MVDGDDIFGDGVNIAARLEALAEPGGICISRMVRDQIRDKLPYPFEDMGEQSVKNIARPVRADAMSAAAVAATPLSGVAPPNLPPYRPTVFSVAIAASLVAVIAIGARLGGRGRTRNSPTIATQSSAAAAHKPRLLSLSTQRRACRSSCCRSPTCRATPTGYFADGITDDLTTDLSRISGSFVIARTPPLPTRAKRRCKQIGRELGVRYVIEAACEGRATGFGSTRN